MTPPNKLEETLSQVVKILRSRGCRRVLIGFPTPFLADIPACRKNPVFVKSIEAAIEVSQVYAREKSEHSLSCSPVSCSPAESAQYSKFPMSQALGLTLYAKPIKQ
jgi:hypothetical protein